MVDYYRTEYELRTYLLKIVITNSEKYFKKTGALTAGMLWLCKTSSTYWSDTCGGGGFMHASANLSFFSTGYK